jgi:hypothetical protein
MTYRQCRKCEKFSGDDWSQCGDACPTEGSPHFKAWAEEIYGRPVVMTEAEMHAYHAAKTTGTCGVCGVNEGKRDHLIGFRCDDDGCVPF